MSVPDRFLGRVFALELAMVTLTMSLSTYLTGWGLDYRGFSPRQMAMILGFAFLVPGIAWLFLQPWLDRGEQAETRAATLAETEPVAETSFPPA